MTRGPLAFALAAAALLAGCGGLTIRFEGDRPADVYIVRGEGGAKTFAGKTEARGPKHVLEVDIDDPVADEKIIAIVETKQGTWTYDEIVPDFDHLIRYPPAAWLFKVEGKGLKERSKWIEAKD